MFTLNHEEGDSEATHQHRLPSHDLSQGHVTADDVIVCSDPELLLTTHRHEKVNVVSAAGTVSVCVYLSVLNVMYLFFYQFSVLNEEFTSLFSTSCPLVTEVCSHLQTSAHTSLSMAPGTPGQVFLS